MSAISDKVSGKMKQTFGDATGNDRMKNEGKGEELRGKAKTLLGNVADKVSEQLDKANDKLEAKKK